MASFRNGDTVKVWPLHARVPLNGRGPDWLPLAGKSVSWSPWWALRLRDGDITLSDPNPAPVAVAAPKADTASKGE